MKIYAICLVKNEEDIIEYCLNAAMEWADKIIVYDNGSTDNTWIKVQEAAKAENKIVAWKSEDKAYHDGLRAEVYNAFKHNLTKGDWWAILDADEFFMSDPKNFLRSVPKKYHKVKTKSFEYLVTKEDAEEFNYANDFGRDRVKLKYYKPQAYSEIRFMRHRDRLVWDPQERRKWPKHSGIVYPHHIALQHYQYRSPDHIRKRLLVRQKADKQGYEHFKRDLVSDWRELMIPRNEAILESNEMKCNSFKDVNVISRWQFFKRRTLHFFRIYP